MSVPTIRGTHPVKFAKVDTAATGDTTIIAAVTGKRIRVIGYTLVVGAATNIKWKSGATDLTGPMALAANGGVTAESNNGCFETGVAEALVINSSGVTVQQSGHVSYVELEP